MGAAGLSLDEPVDRLLPELANRGVLKRLDGPIDDTVRLLSERSVELAIGLPRSGSSVS
jgi:hypothetical protein